MAFKMNPMYATLEERFIIIINYFSKIIVSGAQEDQWEDFCYYLACFTQDLAIEVIIPFIIPFII